MSDRSSFQRVYSKAGERGFTLLELLLALALFAMIAAALYGTWFSVQKGRESVIGGMDQRRALRDTLDMLRRELSSTISGSVNGRPAFVVEDRDNFGRPVSRLAFAAIAPPAAGNLPLSDQLSVEYGVSVNGDSLSLDRATKDLHHVDKPFRYTVMEPIEGFLVECSPDGVKWVRSWDTAINMAIPRAVRVTVAVREGGVVREYSTIASPRISGR
jgi:general secretion pathway protein J